MSTATIREKVRHAEERGAILRVLSEDFSTEMTSTGGVLNMLDLLGYPVSAEGFATHLRYLKEQGYIQVWRTRDMPGFRADRPLPSGSPNDIRFVRLCAKGLQLVDGLIDPDPSVRFA